MDSEYQHRKASEALQLVAVVLHELRGLPGQPWVGFFERLEHSLAIGDIEGAVRARDAIPLAGMGGFLEFLEAFPQIRVAERELMDLVGDLKLYLRYGVDRERSPQGT